MRDERDVLRVGDQDAQEAAAEAFFRTELADVRSSAGRRFGEKFVLAALESLPWVGVFVAAGAATRDAADGARTDRLQTLWLEQFSEKFRRLRALLDEMGTRFDALGDEVHARVESEEYLQIVRKAFRAWDRAETDEKQRYFANLLMNAGAGATVTSDDIVRLFIEWIDTYNEAHFSVIKQVYDHPSGITRKAIWLGIHGAIPREDSAEADLFRLLIYDLNTGRVVRQHRDTTPDGAFLEKPRAPRSNAVPAGTRRTVETSFEDKEPYVLTALGKDFVHYVMTEYTTRLSEGSR
ncbi:MAG: hypothetical protein C4558_09035 [Dehalococcoidia bacterium]|nr:MAG: hypothetical protein C4558_09035 [Dehalococcoidia bacterium]